MTALVVAQDDDELRVLINAHLAHASETTSHYLPVSLVTLHVTVTVQSRQLCPPLDSFQ